MYNVLDLKNDLSGVLHGTTNNQIQNLDGVINRAARQLLLDLDPQETKRTVEFIGPIFNTVYEYPLAADVKGNKIIDIKPQVNRLPWDIWTQAYNQAFDVWKQNLWGTANMFTINFNTSLKTLLVNAPYLNPPVIIDQIEAVAENGTWSAGGTATDLQANNQNFAQGAGSLQINVTTGAAYIENSTLSPVNLSEVLNQASFFNWVSIPVGANLTSVELRIGSSPTDYYHLTVTQTQQATVFVNGWNLEQYPWADMAVFGSPDPSALTYARITLNITDSMNGVLINGLNNILGTILQYEYYSKYMFRSYITGAYQETVLDDSDLINLDTESYNLLFNKVAELAVQQMQGLDATFYDGAFFKNAYDAGVVRYRAMYKSELQKPQNTYYPIPNPSNSRWIGRGWN